MKWVSINDQLPKLGDWYLVLTKRGVYDILFRDYVGSWHDAKLCRPQDRVTHWCSLPPKPNKIWAAIEKIRETQHLIAYFNYAWPGVKKNLADILILLEEYLHEMP